MKKNDLIIRKDDYELLHDFLKGKFGKTLFDRQNAEALNEELAHARIVNATSFPEKVVRLHSRVKVKEDKNDRVLEFILVTPDKADIKQQKISVLTPMGVALIGFREGTTINRQMPAGMRSFTILEVHND